MNQNEQGTLYPFRLSGSRMRQSANQLRRQGQALDALALVRRAAEQDDTPSAWQALAAELRQLGNWEASAQLLARVLSREPQQPGVWMDMARCLQALDQSALAVECAYHQLHEDPWSPEGDAARSLLAELEPEEDPREPRRVLRMIHRGMTAWQSGQRELGERRIRRALRLTASRARLLGTAAMMCMLEMDFAGALKYLPGALREKPSDARTLLALSTLYQQMGKPRMARGFLQRAAVCAQTVPAEDSFLSVAWAQDAWTEMQDYLADRMKRLPHRAALLSAKATMSSELGDMPQAVQLWRELLSINPDDRRAATMIAWTQSGPETCINLPGMLPREEKQRQMAELQQAVETLPMTELLRCGGRPRRLMDWMLESSDLRERQTAMELLREREISEEMTAYLKELVCRPFLPGDVRQWALIWLAETGCRKDLLMLTGGHFTTVQCEPLPEGQSRKPWRLFLPMLLAETRRYGQSNDIVDFAASLWQCMSDAQRMEAAASGRYVWCKAMEILYLRMVGEDAQAARVAARMPLSARRVSRVLRRLARYIGNDIHME